MSEVVGRTLDRPANHFTTLRSDGLRSDDPLLGAFFIIFEHTRIPPSRTDSILKIGDRLMLHFIGRRSSDKKIIQNFLVFNAKYISFGVLISFSTPGRYPG